MGVFDTVNYPAQPCWKCGEMVGGPGEWQSKDGACAMVEVEPWQVHHFYALCDACEAWNEYNVTIVGTPQFVVTLDQEAGERSWSEDP